ncbi:MAG: DUF333 domain-containing protein [Patescibacteria group bacterium]
MVKRNIFIFFLICFLTTISGCGDKPQSSYKNTNQIANPASVYCEEKGGIIEIRQNETGQAGWCIFPDQSECEEWAFFRNECLPQTLQSLEGGQLQKCITGYDYFGKNKFQLVPIKKDCAQITTEEELNNFCGKDTDQILKCDNLIKLISTNPQAGNMFFQGSKILTCPNQNATDIKDMSQDCQNALAANCQITIFCD